MLFRIRKDSGALKIFLMCSTDSIRVLNMLADDKGFFLIDSIAASKMTSNHTETLAASAFSRFREVVY